MLYEVITNEDYYKIDYRKNETIKEVSRITSYNVCYTKLLRENQTLASITFQNYFRLYDKLAGMTGTADTEAFEFQQSYNFV